MGVDGITAVLVVAVTLTRLLAAIRLVTDHFDDPFKLIDKGWGGVGQIDREFHSLRRCVAAADKDRDIRDTSLVQQLMRQETDVPEGP